MVGSLISLKVLILTISECNLEVVTVESSVYKLHKLMTKLFQL